MIGSFLKKIVGSKNERELKKLEPLVQEINNLEQKIKGLTDEELQAFTPQLKDRLNKGEDIDALIPEAFAVVREVSIRIIGMRHFDVQLIGGIVLHQGKIAEMKTGEGKTLAATLPLYLNALTGKGAHLVTVNDYLAKRDAQWMGPIYHFLGLSTGVIQHESSFFYDPDYAMADDRLLYLRSCTRQEAYRADITYGTNNEYGFDYLRDNMKFELSDYVQKKPNYAIVDEVDSILIDEARTPLIISGPTEDSTDKYYQINKMIPRLKKEVHYTIDEKARSAVLTEDGVAKVEELLGIENLYEPGNIETLHHVNQALKAHTIFQRDVDYVVKEDKVLIVDEFTGRLMPGRRYGDGLHQALEAREGVTIENENQTLASITFQNYFRMYDNLAGMTGTADTEALEFHSTYGLDVMVIPTNMPMIRNDFPDAIYKTEKEKFNAVVEEIEELSKAGRPVLVGTISIEKSEKLGRVLKKRGIRHHVLNAKHHEKEAEIISQAGRKGAVTIATNMAGRGTDIVLGGNPEMLAATKAGRDEDSDAYSHALNVTKEMCEEEKKEILELGGLHIIGTERHESRRIDNQLRGRSGRQGDPGSSRFYLSLEDDLLRIFGSDRISTIMDKLGMEEGEPIEHNLVSKAIEGAQRKVEGHNFDIRKHLLEYDDVMNQQRVAIYTMRRQVLSNEGLRDMMGEFIEEIAEEMGETYVEERSHSEDWDKKAIEDAVLKSFNTHLDDSLEGLNKESLVTLITDKAKSFYKTKELEIGDEILSQLERIIMLQVMDTLWKDHLLVMDHLKEGIGWRGYGQKNPLQEYKKEGFELYANMIYLMKEETVERLFTVQIAKETDLASASPERNQRFIFGRGDAPPETQQTVKKEGDKVGRNDPCPCGSGKKYKKCHGR
ncbi:MAG: preprotein translocase subunit SecA [Thermodesulfobacteriota bacterium]